MKAKLPSISVCALLLILANAVPGQEPAPSAPIRTLHEIGNPSLIYAFLHLHERIVRDIEAARRSDPPMVKDLEQGLIALYAADKPALDIITSVQQETQIKLDKLSVLETEYVRPFLRRPQSADIGRLSGFANDRFVILEATIMELDKRLSQMALSKLIGYIDGTMRKQVKSIPIGMAQPKQAQKKQ